MSFPREATELSPTQRRPKPVRYACPTQPQTHPIVAVGHAVVPQIRIVENALLIIAGSPLYGRTRERRSNMGLKSLHLLPPHYYLPRPHGNPLKMLDAQYGGIEAEKGPQEVNEPKLPPSPRLKEDSAVTPAYLHILLVRRKLRELIRFEKIV